jgi:hypothetical protein
VRNCVRDGGVSEKPLEQIDKLLLGRLDHTILRIEVYEHHLNGEFARTASSIVDASDDLKFVFPTGILAPRIDENALRASPAY